MLMLSKLITQLAKHPSHLDAQRSRLGRGIIEQLAHFPCPSYSIQRNTNSEEMWKEEDAHYRKQNISDISYRLGKLRFCPILSSALSADPDISLSGIGIGLDRR